MQGCDQNERGEMAEGPRSFWTFLSVWNPFRGFSGWQRELGTALCGHSGLDGERAVAGDGADAGKAVYGFTV